MFIQDVILYQSYFFLKNKYLIKKIIATIKIVVKINCQVNNLKSIIK